MVVTAQAVLDMLIMYSIDYNGLCLYEVFCCLLILLLVFSAVMSGRPLTRTDRILRNAANIALQREVTAIEQRLQHEITTEAVSKGLHDGDCLVKKTLHQ